MDSRVASIARKWIDSLDIYVRSVLQNKRGMRKKWWITNFKSSQFHLQSQKKCSLLLVASSRSLDSFQVYHTADKCITEALTFEVKANAIKKYYIPLIVHRSSFSVCVSSFTSYSEYDQQFFNSIASFDWFQFDSFENSWYLCVHFKSFVLFMCIDDLWND